MTHAILEPHSCRLAAIGLSAAVIALVSLAPEGALAQTPQTYVGAHPLDHAGHWHDVEGEHTHEGLAIGDSPFGEVDDRRVFLADPIAWGWDEDVYTYRNTHPIPGLAAYCGIAHAHAHTFAPEGSYRRDDRGGYTFVGGLRGGRAMLRPEELSPDEPVVRPGAAPPAMVPFWYAGCLQVWNPRAPGGAAAFPLYGCRPNADFQRAWFSSGVAPRRTSPARRPPPASSTSFRGSTRTSPPGRRPSPTGGSRQ